MTVRYVGRVVLREAGVGLIMGVVLGMSAFFPFR